MSGGPALPDRESLAGGSERQSPGRRRWSTDIIRRFTAW